MFGEWRQHFSFPPVPYRDGGAKLKAFREKVQSELRKEFLYSNEVSLTITLYLDVQSVLETDETADLDNYAKSLLDALKGDNGLLIDDNQVQALSISWIDSAETCFEVEIRGAPDDFVLKPLKLYEMPDGLWYPHSTRLWTDGAAADAGEKNFNTGLLINEKFAALQKGVRHKMRTAGLDRLRTYQNGRYLANAMRGFHKSRVIDSGFELIPKAAWKPTIESWIDQDPFARKTASKIDDMLTTMADTVASGAAKR